MIIIVNATENNSIDVVGKKKKERNTSNIKINTHRKGCRTKLSQSESLSVVSNYL